MPFATGWAATSEDGPQDFERFWLALTRHLQSRAIALDMSRARARIDQEDDYDFRTVFAALLAAQAEVAGKTRAGEKTPGHEHHLERIFQWFPSAQVIFVRRDPRACAASVLETPWVMAQLSPSNLAAPLIRRLRVWHIAFKAQEWLASHQAERAWRAAPAVATIAYEDLVASPEHVLRQLCTFLDEPWEDVLLDTRGASMTDPDKPGIRWREWNAAHEIRAGAPINDQSLYRWRQTLSDLEISVVEAACEAELRELGYQLVTPESERREALLLYERVLRLEGLERGARERLKTAITTPFRPWSADGAAGMGALLRRMAGRLAPPSPFQ